MHLGKRELSLRLKLKTEKIRVLSGGELNDVVGGLFPKSRTDCMLLPEPDQRKPSSQC